MEQAVLGNLAGIAVSLIAASGCDYYNRFNAGPPTPLDQAEAFAAAQQNVEAFVNPDVVAARVNNPVLAWDQAETPAYAGMLLPSNNVNMGTGIPEQDGSVPPSEVEIAH